MELYPWCDGVYILGSVVHLGTHHYIMMRSIYLSICQEPPSRLWKPPEVTDMLSSVSGQLLQGLSILQNEIYETSYLHKMMDNIRGEVTAKMSILHSVTKYAIPTRTKFPSVQSRPMIIPEKVRCSMPNHSTSVDKSAQMKCQIHFLKVKQNIHFITNKCEPN